MIGRQDVTGHAGYKMISMIPAAMAWAKAGIKGSGNWRGKPTERTKKIGRALAHAGLNLPCKSWGSWPDARMLGFSHKAPPSWCRSSTLPGIQDLRRKEVDCAVLLNREQCISLANASQKIDSRIRRTKLYFRPSNLGREGEIMHQ